MESFDIQVLLKDGSFADYQVLTDGDKYQILDAGKLQGIFRTDRNGTWSMENNSGDIDSDLQGRIINQLKGFES